MTIYRWSNAQQTAFVVADDAEQHYTVVDVGHPLWGTVDVAQIAPHSEQVALPPTAEELRISMSLSFAQLLIGLVTEGWITEAEGEAWLTGTLPAAVLSLIATLPAGQQFAAKARATAPSEVLRLDPLVASLGAAQGKTEAELDAFFTTYAAV